MRKLKQALRAVAKLIIFAAVCLNLYIYNYNHFKSECSWPDKTAAIRLLAFGDPQIRGLYPATPFRMKVDINGNDFFLGHVYSVMTRKLRPTHVAVMGDLLSSQWISDEEFFKRAERYRNRIFTHNEARDGSVLVNVSGNHDIGYAGEMTPERITRYEVAFGKVNYVQEYDNWRLVVLNSLALDGPSVVPTFHQDTQLFLHDVKNSGFKGASVLLTHVPLAKPHGVCKDGPAFVYYEHGTLYEQNHLSEAMTNLVLDSVFGKGNPYGGVIVTGHDHEGCESVYQYQDENENWSAHRLENPGAYQNAVKEFTVRSMMGEYGGNTGIMSGTLHPNQTWTFDYNMCRFAVQHLWWVTQVFTIIAVFSLVVFLF